MNFFKTKKYSILSNVSKYSFIGVLIFIMSMPTFFVNNSVKIVSAANNTPTLSVFSVSSTSVTLTATGLKIGSTYRINLINSENVIGNNHWDLNSVISSTVTTTSPSTSHLVPDTYIAKLSDGSSYIATSSNFAIISKDNLPKITSFSPTSGKVGDTITLTGENFTGTNKVRFGEIVEVIPDTNNGTVITVKVPRAAVTGKLYVFTTHGNAGSLNDFTFISTNNPRTCSNGATNYPTCTLSARNDGNAKITDTDVTFNGLVPNCNTGPIDPVTKNYANPCDFNMVMTIINKVITFLLITLATPLFALILVYVGWLYLSDMGSSENKTKAKKILKNALIGYVIALAAWLIVKTILSSVGFNGPMFLG